MREPDERAGPLISIVTATHNVKGDLAKTAESTRHQTDRNIQWIVIDR
jgi:glycosyltransferase involved in cell wall biosynthesis